MKKLDAESLDIKEERSNGSFKDSVVKTNAIQVLKQADIDEVVRV